MTPAARLETVIAALAEMAEAGRPADTVLAKFFRARRFIGAKDRGAVATTIYRILRSEARLQWWMERVQTAPTVRSLVLADQLLTEKLTVDELRSLCDGSRYAPAMLTDSERAMALQMEGLPLDHAEMPDHVRYECPEWMWPQLAEAYGERLPELLLSLQHAAPLDLRVNTLKADRKKLLKEMVETGWQVEETPYAPHGLRLHARPNLNAHPALQNGDVEIQDEGSQLIGLLADAQPGMRVLDFCAGAGGKSLAMAAAMDNKGRIIACDVAASRLKRSALRFRRAGVHNIEVQALASENDPWLKRHKGTFDRVLVDAPCSGTGTWRRNPESRWRQLGPALDELTDLQQSILVSAARLVKPGGRLIYATCSLLPRENGLQIDRFLKDHYDFSLLPVSEVWQALLPSQPQPSTGDTLSLNPLDHGTDGFFAAILLRNT